MIFRKMKLNQCCVSISDGDHQPPPKADNGIPFITISDINENNHIDFSNTMCVPSEYYDSLDNKRKVQKNDVLYSVVGSFGKPVLINDNKKFVFQRHIAILRANEDVVSPKYLYYSLMNPLFYRKAEKYAIGAAQRTISLESLRNLEIDVPSIEEQNNVVSILDKLDAKISCNNKINDNLEQMLCTLYEYNFIQNSEKTWNMMSLDKVAELYQPKTISSTDLTVNGKYYVYGANGIIGKYSKYNHAEPQIAVACRGASCGSLTMTLPYSWITGNAMIVDPKSEFQYKEFLYYTLSKKSVSYLMSGSAQPQLTRDNMSIYNLIIPPTDILDTFEKKARKARAVMISNQIENNELIQLRDWLLPMLMNGQASITD